MPRGASCVTGLNTHSCTGGPIPTSTQGTDRPLTAAELKEFRTLATEASSRPGYSITRVAEELGFADSSPLRKLLRDPKRTTSRERLELMRRIRSKAAGASSGASAGVKTALASKGASVAKTAPASKSASGMKSAPAGGAAAAAAKGGARDGAGQGGGDDDFVTGAKAQEFKSRVKQLRQGGWTLDSLATRIGYHHGRSLNKALAKGQVRRRIYDALMTVPARSDGAGASRPAAGGPAAKGGAGGGAAKGGAAKGGAAAKSGGASRPAATAKTTGGAPAGRAPASGAAAGGRQSGGLLGGAGAHLESARRHLEQARDEVRRAGSASQLLAPGLRGVVEELDALSRRLNL